MCKGVYLLFDTWRVSSPSTVRRQAPGTRVPAAAVLPSQVTIKWPVQGIHVHKDTVISTRETCLQISEEYLFLHVMEIMALE